MTPSGGSDSERVWFVAADDPDTGRCGLVIAATAEDAVKEWFGPHYDRSAAYVEVIEKSPVLDLLEAAWRQDGAPHTEPPSECAPCKLSNEIEAFLKARGRLLDV
jgi:hypothetical protein